MQEPQETGVPFQVWEDHLEKGMTTRSIILASRIPRTEESFGPQTIVTQSPKGLDQLSKQAHTPREGRGGLSPGRGAGPAGQAVRAQARKSRLRNVSCLYPLSVLYGGRGCFGGQS